MNRKINKWDARTIALKIGAIVLAAILLISSGLFFLEIREKKLAENRGSTQKLEETLTYKGKNFVLKDNVETFLVLGLDKFDNEDSGSYNNDKQADFLLLIVVDNEAKTCRAIHIDRDTMADVNMLGVAGDKIGTVNKQIALAHTYGNGREVSCRNTANAVSGVLMGVGVDHYASLIMEAVPVLNDLIGGVTVEIMDDFYGIDDTLIKGETVTLMGDHALNYVRSRKGLDDSSNNNRMHRQKQYLNAFFDQFRAAAEADEFLLTDVALEMVDYIVSDCSVSKLENILKKISGYSFDGILNIEGKNKRGEQFMEFYPDKDSVKEIVVSCFYEEANNND